MRALPATVNLDYTPALSTRLKRPYLVSKILLADIKIMGFNPALGSYCLHGAILGAPCAQSPVLHM